MTLDKMRERKRELGYSYETISELSGVPLPTVQKVLGGITKSPRYETIRALEKVLAPAEHKHTLYPEYRSQSFGVHEAGSFHGDYEYGSSPEKLPVYDDSYPLLPHKRQGEYTEKDREQLPKDLRTELIDGELFDLPSPVFAHQIILGELYTALKTCTDNHQKDCIVVMSPSDVYLDGNDKTVVQPDLYVVCDYPPKLTKNGYLEGAPAFIAEVLSPSTRTKDMFLKAYKYSEAGVAEYWIIDPQKKRVLVYQFGKDSDNDCDCIIYGFEDIIPVGISDGLCSVDFSGISKLLTRLGISE